MKLLEDEIRENLDDLGYGDAYFFKDLIYLFIFRDRGRKEEREGEKHQLVASWTPPTGELASTYPDQNQTSNLLVCRLVLNPLSHSRQG